MLNFKQIFERTLPVCTAATTGRIYQPTNQTTRLATTHHFTEIELLSTTKRFHFQQARKKVLRQAQKVSKPVYHILSFPFHPVFPFFNMPAKMSDQASDIICVAHCDHKIFALTFPDTCSKCQANLRECDLKNPPFTVPSPFSR